jgi:hypothetical protein
VNRHTVPNAVMGFPGRPRDGGSRPRFYHFDDDVTRLVKWHPSVQGPKACYNELVASRLGQLIGAPILRGVVVYVPDAIIPADHRADGATAGFHFAATMMEGDNFLPTQHYGEIENSSQLPSAAVHLAWLNVGDQQSHNQFLQRRDARPGGPGKTVRFMLIDMRFMFGGPAWVGSTLQPHTSYALPPHLADKLTLAKLQPTLDALRGAPDAAIRDCFESRPAEWNITDQDVAQGIAVAIHGRDRIDEIIKAGNPTIS